MREIKFRAWSRVHKKMWTGGINLNYQDEGMASVDLLDEKYEYETHFLKPGFDTEPEAVLMQYTGLKDKNGVEIYEGDIVKGKSGSYAIEFNQSGGWIATNNLPLWAFHQPEVIGNIYENPELLND